MDKQKNLNNKCRTCLNRSKGLQLLEKMAIEDTSREISYAELLKEVTNINIEDDKISELPQFICTCCARKLKSSHAFIIQAKEANEKLLAMLHTEIPPDKDPPLDCLQESQIDINICLEIKLENTDEIKRDELESVKPMEEDENAIYETPLETDKTNEMSKEPNAEDTPYDLSLPHDDDFGFESDSSKRDADFSDSSDSEIDNGNDFNANDPYGQKGSRGESKKNTSKEDDSEDLAIAVPCTKCNKIFKNSKVLARHLRNTHVPEEQKCTCPLCGVKFTRTCNMFKHMRTQHDPDTVKTLLPASEKMHQCDKCPQKYTKKKHLNNHIKAKHSNEGDVGDKTTDDSKAKAAEDRSLCSICGCSFSKKAYLIVHMRRHTGERPFQCDLCDRAFPHNSELKCHRRIHTGEKPYKCKLCEKAFRVYKKLATHMRSHTDERPYKCNQCERSFKYSKDLNIHHRIHTGERPYLCTVCGSTFTQSNSLKAHRMKLGHMEDSTTVAKSQAPPVMHLLLKKMDLKDICNKCRTCLTYCNRMESLGQLVHVDKTSQEMSYAELIKEIVHLNNDVDIMHRFPQNICLKCSQQLKSAYVFIKQVKEVDEKIWSILNRIPTMDCLQESEIDIQTCTENKIYNKREIVMEDDEIKEISKQTLEESLCVDLPHTLEPEEIGGINTPGDIRDYSDDNSETEEHLEDEATNIEIPNFSEEIKEKFKRTKSIDKSDDDIAVPCLKCHKIFNNSTELSRHLRNTHLPEEQKCACPLCGIKFTRSCNMYKHMRTLHDPDDVNLILPRKEKPFQCEMCPRRYTQKRQLNCHIKEKHQNGENVSKADEDSKKKSEVRPLCFVCGSSFSNKAHLIVHMTRHTGEKPFQCDLCDRAFPRISDLTCHRRIHTGEKPFKCKICDKAFRVSTKLATHMRSHTNERPYKCKQCEKSFKYSKDLNIHRRTHTGERPYCCNVCGSTFTQSNSLKAHRTKLGHMDDATPQLGKKNKKSTKSFASNYLKYWFKEDAMSFKPIVKCRACFRKTKGLKSIWDVRSAEPLLAYADLLKEVANIDVKTDPNPETPKFICGPCIKGLTSSYEFLNQVKEANVKYLSSSLETSSVDKCMEESEIDIWKCLEIKVEDDDTELKKSVKNNLDELNVETKKKNPLYNPLAGEDNETKVLPNPLEKIVQETEFDVKDIMEIKEEIDADTDADQKETANRYEMVVEPKIATSQDNILNDTAIPHDEKVGDDKQANLDDKLDSDSSNGYTEDESDDDNMSTISETSHKLGSKGKRAFTKTTSNQEEMDVAVACPQCDKVFTNCKAFKSHCINAHVPEDQKCSCPICGAKFTRSYSMYYHMRTRHGPESVKDLLPQREKTYQCDKCPRSYTKDKYLKRHTKEKHSGTQEQLSSEAGNTKKSKKTEIHRPLCSICGSSFPNKTQLTIHMRRHTGDMPFKCELCERAFPRVSELKYHQRVHTGEKPYKCKLCDKAFRVSAKLSSHMRSHSDERPYKCKHCEKSFKYSKDLNIHTRVHTGEMPYSCNVCGTKFSQTHLLKVHRTKTGHIDEGNIPSKMFMHFLSS
ncbi:uncharacterized protein LOC142224809 [Haematobia irritans]|uniref:uncharacterized protein LOC142224809 n=1 Tax=Haematobia irritans TaxID=7368 RepID=UPI003F4F55CC